jgi:hypothetical protein
MIMKIVHFSLVVCIIVFAGCAGTKTIKTTEKNSSLNKLGLAHLYKQTPVTDTLFPNLEAFYFDISKEQWLSSGYTIFNKFIDSVQFENPNLDKIIKICQNNNLDGIVLSRIAFTLKKEYLFIAPLPIPMNEYYDNILDLKLIDKHGTLVTYIKHNSATDVYWSVPEDDVIIKTSIKKSISQLIKQLNK